jgi:hypothetical protein
MRFAEGQSEFVALSPVSITFEQARSGDVFYRGEIFEVGVDTLFTFGAAALLNHFENVSPLVFCHRHCF